MLSVLSNSSKLYYHFKERDLSSFENSSEMAMAMIDKGQIDEFKDIIDNVTLIYAKRLIFRKVIKIRPSWLNVLMEKGWEGVINFHIILDAANMKLPARDMRLLCELYNPTLIEWEDFIKYEDKNRLEQFFEIAEIFNSKLLSNPIFIDLINKEEFAKILLRGSMGMPRYKLLHEAGWKSHWFNFPRYCYDDPNLCQTLMHQLIRQGDVKYMQRLLADIPLEEIHLGPYFELEDFTECLPAYPSVVLEPNQLESAVVAQRGCSMILQTQEELLTVPGVNARDFANSHSLFDGESEHGVTIYLNRNHASVRLTSSRESIDRGLYPSEDSSTFLIGQACSIVDDIGNRAASASTNELVLHFPTNSQRHTEAQNYINKTKIECLNKTKSYSLLSFNCVDFANEVAQRTGFLRFIGDAFTPKQLIRRVKPLPGRHAMAAQYSLAKSYGATLALAQLSTPLAIGYAEGSSPNSPNILDVFLTAILCYTLYRMVRLCLRAFGRSKFKQKK